MKKYSWVFVLLLTLVFVAVGCGKGSASAATKAFDSANPEAKAMWDKVLTAAKSDDYVPAVVMCRTLAARTDITPEQSTAIGDKLTEINEKLNAEAEKGDKKAQAALAELKSANRR